MKSGDIILFPVKLCEVTYQGQGKIHWVWDKPSEYQLVDLVEAREYTKLPLDYMKLQRENLELQGEIKRLKSIIKYASSELSKGIV